MNETPGFEVVPTNGVSPREHVVAGFASPDLAALTAVDYLIDTHEATRVAAIRTRGLPDVATITDGQPRHPIRGYTIDALDVTVLVAEVFVPVSLADQFATALGEWLESGDVSSFTLLHGGQFPHSEEQHPLPRGHRPVPRPLRRGGDRIAPVGDARRHRRGGATSGAR